MFCPNSPAYHKFAKNERGKQPKPSQPLKCQWNVKPCLKNLSSFCGQASGEAFKSWQTFHHTSWCQWCCSEGGANAGEWERAVTTMCIYIWETVRNRATLGRLEEEGLRYKMGTPGSKITFQVWIDHKNLEALKKTLNFPLNKHIGCNTFSSKISLCATSQGISWLMPYHKCHSIAPKQKYRWNSKN